MYLFITAQCNASAVYAVVSCLSVCSSVPPSQAAIVSKHRITHWTPYLRDSNILTPKISSKLRWGHPQWSRQTQVSWAEICDCRPISRYISETEHISTYLIWKAFYQMAQFPLTLSDLKPPESPALHQNAFHIFVIGGDRYFKFGT